MPQSHTFPQRGFISWKQPEGTLRLSQQLAACIQMCLDHPSVPTILGPTHHNAWYKSPICKGCLLP